MRRVGAVAALFFVLAGALGADAAERRVALGEVSSHVVRKDIDVTRVLKSSAQEELSTLDLARVAPPKDKVIVSVSLVRMEDDAASATCVVSATLRGERSGKLFAILEGKARASQPQANADENALRGAVRGAMMRVPDALKGAQ